MKIAVDIVRKYGGVFICDEVQTGFGRTGRMWGIDGEGVEPDVVTMAKGIANGFPISAVVTTSAIADAWKGGNISTFGGNPISCAAANATIDVIVDEGLAANAATHGHGADGGPRRAASGATASSATCAAAASCSAWSSCATSRRATARRPPTRRSASSRRRRSAACSSVAGASTATSFASRRRSSSRGATSTTRSRSSRSRSRRS